MINPINKLYFAPIQSRYNIKQHQFLSGLKADTVSFGNIQPDLLSQPSDKVFNQVISAIEDEDILGAGGEAVVYKIADTGYCARIIRDFLAEDMSFLRDKFDKSITQQEKVNHVVGKFGKYLTIMPIINGKAIRTYDQSEHEIWETSKEFEKISQSAYNGLLRQISDAYKNGMLFDCNWSNVIFDVSSQKLVAIDFYKNDTENPEPARHLPYMHAALTHEHTTRYQHSVIAEKIMNAGLNELKAGVIPCCDFSEFGFSRLITNFKNSGLFKDTKYDILLRQSMEKIEALKCRELRGEDVTNALNGQINIVKTVMRQLVAYNS